MSTCFVRENGKQQKVAYVRLASLKELIHFKLSPNSSSSFPSSVKSWEAPFISLYIFLDFKYSKFFFHPNLKLFFSAINIAHGLVRFFNNLVSFIFSQSIFNCFPTMKLTPQFII